VASRTRAMLGWTFGGSGSKDFLQRRQVSEAVRNCTSLQASQRRTSRWVTSCTDVSAVLSVTAFGWTSNALMGAIRVAISCVLRTAARAGTVRLRPITEAGDVLRVTPGAIRVKSIAGDSGKKMVESGIGTKVVHRLPPLGIMQVEAMHRER
jgi:hypothetical protein